MHLLPWTKLIGPSAMLFLIFPQIEASHDPSQAAVGNAPAVFILEDLLNPDHITLSEFEYLLDDGRKLLIGGLSQRCLLPLSPEDPSDRVSREFEDLADLPHGDSPLIKAHDGLLVLLSDHRNHPS
jgi:hypothetical protein